MKQATFPIYKSRPMRPFLYSHLVTSTPDSHQVSKRIKGLLGHSEHYKGNRVDYPNVGPNFSPLRTRDYRKARELTLEIWDPTIQASFLERFLKSQRNLHTIRIKVLTERAHKGEILKQLSEILSKNSRLNRVHIDFYIGQIELKSELMNAIRSLRSLPRLKDLEVTVDGKQILPFSVSLTKVGFESDNPHLADPTVIERLMKKTLKFYQLDTIKISSLNANWFGIALAMVISNLPSFRELDFNFSEGFNFPLEYAVKILDSLVKAPNFKILRLGFPLDERSQISLLKHALFKGKSLERTSLSICFIDYFATPAYFNEIFNLLREVPSLYELSLRFLSFVMSEIAEDHIKKMSRITSIRKLKIMFDFSSTSLNEKQAGGLLKSILDMHFLEELNLQLPQDCFELNAREIQGLARLKKISLLLERPQSGEGANDMSTIIEILGKCRQLRQLKLMLHKCVLNYQEMMPKLCESLRKLKRLQIFKIYDLSNNETSILTMDSLESLVQTCRKLRDLQDLTVQMGGSNFMAANFMAVFNLRNQLSTNKKYRMLDEPP